MAGHGPNGAKDATLYCALAIAVVVLLVLNALRGERGRVDPSLQAG